MDIVLVPGLWLDGSTWDAVVPELARAGHRARPVTLPGMRAADADRAGVTTADLVAAVVAAVDESEGPVLLVGHSASCGLVHAAVDARPDRVARAVHVGGWPSGDGEALVGGFPVEHGEIALPDWSAFDEADLTDLDDAARDDFRRRAIPAPAAFTEPVHLRDPRRYGVPVTLVCPEYRADAVQSWLNAGEPSLAELARIRSVTLVDVPTGHWPQLTKPAELAAAILGSRPTRLTFAEFHATEGLADWRGVYDGAIGHFRTGSYAQGVSLVAAVGAVVAELGGEPDVDLRPDAVTVRLLTREVLGLSERDVALAQRISAAAGELGAVADPAAAQTVQITIDAADVPAAQAFWTAALGYHPDGSEDAVDPRGRGPAIWFQSVQAGGSAHGRVHVDVCVPHDEGESRVAAAVAAGGRVVFDEFAPAWWTVTDPEGNVVDIATWQGRGW